MTLIVLPAFLFAESSSRQPLFKIERNKNANIVQYDAQVDVDGELLENEPVVANWIRLAEQGQVQELSWVQKRFAYGFELDFDRESSTVKMEMKIDLGRTITVARDVGDYRAMALIAGSHSYLEKIFINASGKGIFTTLNYIEMYGNDAATGERRYEKFSP